MWFRHVSGLKAAGGLLALMLLLAACAAPTPPQSAAQAPESQATLPLESQASATPESPPGATPENQASATPETPLCSPLAVQPLEKLSEIITQPFAMPRVLSDGRYSDDAHHGVDLGYYTRAGKNFTGTQVLAALTGRIAALVADRPPYGNAILLETPFEQIPAWLVRREQIPAGSSLYTLYAHLQNVAPLRLGQEIACGQPLAETGLTGFTGGPHLHFETRWGPAEVQFPDGLAFYRADTTESERANYDTWRMSGQFHLFDPMELFTANE